MIGTITVTIETGIGLAGPDPFPAATDTGVTVVVTHKEVTLDPITDSHTAVHHATEAQVCTVTDETPHTADPHHAEVFPETAVDLDHTHHTTPPENINKTVFQLRSKNLENQRQET